ncbi:MAG: hypothetical protein AMS17_13125 [Spirochaetes bacterium DG_61]|nr:MAG: hypothetical protein AMS17_13125 [Spirochaetes bacterium DG_61]
MRLSGRLLITVSSAMKSAAESDGYVKGIFQRLADCKKEHARMMKEEMGRIISRNALDLRFYPSE